MEILIGVVAFLMLLFGIKPRKKAKVYEVTSAEWAHLLRVRKDGRGWLRKKVRVAGSSSPTSS